MPQKSVVKSKAKASGKLVKAKKVAVVKSKPLKVKAKSDKLSGKSVVQIKPATAKVVPPVEQAKAALKKENSVAEALIFAESSNPAAAEGKVKKPRAKKLSITIAATEAASALAQKWATLFKKADQIEVKPYNMRGVFEEKTAITHKLLGWGYILSNRNDRLEVLFKDGIKYLISNYKN